MIRKQNILKPLDKEDRKRNVSKRRLETPTVTGRRMQLECLGSMWLKYQFIDKYLFGLNGGNKPWFRADKMYYIIKNKYYNPEASNTISIYKQGEILTVNNSNTVKEDIRIKINDTIYSCYLQTLDSILIFDKIKYCFVKPYNYYRIIRVELKNNKPTILTDKFTLPWNLDSANLQCINSKDKIIFFFKWKQDYCLKVIKIKFDKTNDTKGIQLSDRYLIHILHPIHLTRLT